MTRIGNSTYSREFTPDVSSSNNKPAQNQRVVLQPIEIITPHGGTTSQNTGTEQTKQPSSALLQQFVNQGGTLAIGHRGEEVKELQSLLNLTGIRPSLRTDGQYGLDTEEAVRRFQVEKGLAVDGVFGPQALEALRLSLGLRELEPGQTENTKPSQQPLNTLLSEHTSQIAEIEKEKEKQLHQSPIINVKKLPVHGKVRSFVPEPVRLSGESPVSHTEQEILLPSISNPKTE